MNSILNWNDILGAIFEANLKSNWSLWPSAPVPYYLLLLSLSQIFRFDLNLINNANKIILKLLRLCTFWLHLNIAPFTRVIVPVFIEFAGNN